MGKKSLILSTCLSVICCFATAVISTFFLKRENSWYLSASIIVIISVLPFFSYFEKRKIKTIELVTIASMTALSAISRLVFAFVPHVKPMAAVVMVTGIAFGPNAGFVVGALSIFASNFFMGQGLYTPYQMLGMGMMGLIAGLIFHKKEIGKRRIPVSLTGFLSVFLIYGFIVDCCSVLMMTSSLSIENALPIFASGVPVNLIHGITTAVVLYVINRPMNNKFERLRKKYGVFDQ